MWFCSGAEGKNECEQGVTRGSCDKDVTKRQLRWPLLAFTFARGQL